MSQVLNAMTVDVEDYFQVSAFAGVVSPDSWDTYESRVAANTDRLLGIFAAADVRGTFFVLGWVAKRFPDLVRRIHAAGHEIASHSYRHELVYNLSPEAFLTDLRRAQNALEDITGTAVRGYRAPSYSITTPSLWAIDVLVSEGYTYDSSIYPIRHDRYGIPDSPRHPYRFTRATGGLWELPGSTVRRAGMNLPMGGGGYFRLLPYGWTRSGIRTLNETEGQPAIFYLHPWEVDPEQPRIRCGAVSAVRHYHNLQHTEPRLKRLLSEFRFGSISDVISRIPAAADKRHG